ncbi:glycosyltransferase [Methylobacterium haplocladii]|uniref:Glycosyl transferase family 28 C-terminal domain-containing protein n=1 Tax=Methylobacterium haplocladii TaxID=1176176 RepID=A0A512IL22_9HYPH|nr:glycosyltransferase [Methylobacterium haplocladii]GEO98420.1 hypothetical protein MHA02_08080 [Methylobacterium haplocladii]GJD83048.1 hypothetical protein HPGCJGGD_0910 [Methylobacterium haplocladii]
MTRPIGIYVHHQGAGHWQRACLIGGALDRPCTLLGTFAACDRRDAPGPLIHLPDDRIAGFDGHDREADRPTSLHYAPLGHPGIRERMARIAAWIAEADPVLMIVDVSVEVALLCRLLSVPTLVVRLAGTRTDPPHLDAFRSASRLLAPFPADLDTEDMPDWIRARTIYSGFLGAAPAPAPEDGRIVVVFGQGGEGGRLAALSEAARAVPDRAWHVLGPVQDVGGAASRPANLHLHGWVADVGAHLAQASLVVGSGGDGVVAAVVGAGKRFVCLPEPRPYDEQASKAEALARLGAAIVQQGWPEGADWPDLVRRGLALDPARIAGLAEPDALARTAAGIEAMAREIEGRPRPGG